MAGTSLDISVAPRIGIYAFSDGLLSTESILGAPPKSAHWW